MLTHGTQFSRVRLECFDQDVRMGDVSNPGALLLISAWMARTLSWALFLLGFTLGAQAEPGRVDSAFSIGTGPRGAGYCAVEEADAGLLIGGDFLQVDGEPNQRLARLDPDGTLDAGYRPDPDGVVRVLVRRADGSVIVGGAFSFIAGTNRHGLARLT